MKNDKGISIISFILTILIFILIGFIGYELFCVDIFEIMDNVATVNSASSKNKVIYNNKDEIEEDEDISIIEPIVDNNKER